MNNWGRTSQETQHNCNNYHSSLLLELHLIEAWKVIDKHWTIKQDNLLLLDKKNVFSWTHKICFSISLSPEVACFDDWSMIDHALLTQNTFSHQSSLHAIWTDIEKITNCTPDKLKGYCRDSQKPGDLKGMQIVKKTNEIKEKNIWEWGEDCDWTCNFLKWRSKRYGLITEHLSIILLFCSWSCSWRILIHTQSARVFHHYIFPFSLLTQSCSYLEVLLETQLHSLLS